MEGSWQTTERDDTVVAASGEVPVTAGLLLLLVWVLLSLSLSLEAMVVVPTVALLGEVLSTQWKVPAQQSVLPGMKS